MALQRAWTILIFFSRGSPLMLGTFLAAELQGLRDTE